MCNSCYKCGKNFCCTSPMPRQCNTSAARLDDCHGFMHLIHHWRPETEYYSKCTCCEQSRCKKNNLIHKLCPVAGMRGRTMQQLLYPTAETTFNTECMPPPTTSAAVIPITATVCDVVQDLQVLENDASVEDVAIVERLQHELKGSETANNSISTQNRKFKNVTRDLTNWYAGEMKRATIEHIERETLKAARESKTRKRKTQSIRSSTMPDRRTYHWSLILPTPSDEEEPEQSATPETDVAVVEQAENAEKVTLDDIRNLLKEIKSKPDRPILFHSPFNRDMIWTWRNYDPLEDLPKSMQKQTLKTDKVGGYSPWTMDIITNVIKGKPISDKQVKSNKELRSAVAELAHEFKMKKLQSGKHKRH